MDEHPSAGGRLDDDAPGSPKRKKMRAKYAPKACVSCRRSKLKCSGENPCHRCLDNGRRCFYSEDQTAAEALQHLSRPAPGPPSSSSSVPANGHGATRRGTLPRSDTVERRASEASLMGNSMGSSMGSSMEARMARIEGMMEALIHDRGIGMTPKGSIDHEDLAGDALPPDPMDALGANLVPVRQSLGYPQDSPELRPHHAISLASPPALLDPSPIVRVGSRNCSFPTPTDYQRYISFFFAKVEPYHQCISEVAFRSRSEQMLVSSVIHPSEINFLALNYIIFACVDALVDASSPPVVSKPPGWHWFQTADELVGKKVQSGHGDLHLLQFLLWQSCYLTYAGQPNAAYNAVGLACRLCFQLNLHQQSKWAHYPPFEVHMRRRTFWAVYGTDRRISLACGRPYGIRDLHFEVDRPLWINDAELFSDQPFPRQHQSTSLDPYHGAMITWSKLAGDVLDHSMSGISAKKDTLSDNASVLDNQIAQCAESILRTLPLLPQEHSAHIGQLRYQTLVLLRFNHLRLLLRRKNMLSLSYDSSTGGLCGDLAIEVVQRIKEHSHEARTADSFRFHMVSALGGATMILATLLVRDLPSLGLRERGHVYAEAFRDGVGMLHELAVYVPIARRVVDDLKDIIPVVTTILNGGPPELLPTNLADLFQGALDPLGQNSASDANVWNGADATNLEAWGPEPQHNSSGFAVLFI